LAAAETKKSIVIYISNLTVWIIPKRSFTELDLGRFKESVYPKFPKKKVEFIKK